jgi:DNA segregation ATPase FtsK/SpoIIIE-like protein
MARRNEDTRTFGIRNQLPSEINLQCAQKDEANVALLTPMWFDELCGELDETELLRAVPIHLGACTRK